ncbi:pimeloyl-ACP methyl ester carboxylesterase [Streptomyces sp. 846.5]|nr:alpha/beta hydrolase [Streptomyces sp. 846.5]TDT97474.1 pimeloyl-ACP methyl ester carboxylesterase [Streptomyces sp. 846.5]
MPETGTTEPRPPRPSQPALRLHFTDTGPRDGAPVLLVHGWGGAGSEWDPVAAELARSHRVIVPDLRGHGSSPAPDPAAAGYAPVDFAADLAALLGGLDAAPVTAVGHSMGGQIVVALAGDSPSLVAGLVVLDPAYGADGAELRAIPGQQEQLRTEGARWAVRFAEGAHTAATPAAVRIRHRRLMAATAPAILAAARDALYLDPDAFGSRTAAEQRLRALSVPVLTVMRTPDRAAWATRTLNHPRSRVETVTGSGHYLHEEQPIEISALISRAGTGGPQEP